MKSEIEKLKMLLDIATLTVRKAEAAARYPGRKVHCVRVPVRGCEVRAHRRGAYVRVMHVPLIRKKTIRKLEKKYKFVWKSGGVSW